MFGRFGQDRFTIFLAVSGGDEQAEGNRRVYKRHVSTVLQLDWVPCGDVQQNGIMYQVGGCPAKC